MKKHLTAGELRAYLDGEPSSIPAHLASCPACQMRLQQVRHAQHQNARRLSFLAAENEAVLPASTAWSRFVEKYLTPKEIPMFGKWFKYPVTRLALAIALTLALTLAFPTTRALAEKFLNLLRVQQVTVLPIDLTSLESMTGNEALASRMSELIADSVQVTTQPGDPQPMADAAQASAAAGFKVRLPAGLAPSSLHIIDASAFTLTLNRNKTQAFIDSAGRADLVLPESMDGARLSLQIPVGVLATFGECPEPRGEKSAPQEEQDQSALYPDCIAFSQMPSPLVSAPADLDMAQLAQIGLEFSGMSQEEAAALTATVDWTSTLVIPIPRRASTYEDVSVDGVTGKLIRRISDYSPEYALIWLKDNIIHAISSTGTDSAPAFEIANTLQ